MCRRLDVRYQTESSGSIYIVKSIYSTFNKRDIFLYKICFTLRKEQDLQVFENEVLSGIFGTGEIKINEQLISDPLQNEKVRDLHNSPVAVTMRVMKLRRLRWLEGSNEDRKFWWRNSASRTVGLGLSQPLTEMSTRNPLGG
jgi:hypothetical protein